MINTDRITQATLLIRRADNDQEPLITLTKLTNQTSMR